MDQQIRRVIMASLLTMFCFVAFAQKTVTGTVKDANGEPMIGVSVMVDGTSIGGITDLDGNFTIQKVPENSVLKSLMWAIARRKSRLAATTLSAWYSKRMLRDSTKWWSWVTAP